MEVSFTKTLWNELIVRYPGIGYSHFKLKIAFESLQYYTVSINCRGPFRSLCRYCTSIDPSMFVCVVL